MKNPYAVKYWYLTEKGKKMLAELKRIKKGEKMQKTNGSETE